MDVSPILARTEAVSRRIRLARALRAGATTFAPGIAGIAVGLGATRLGWMAASDLPLVVAIGLGVPLAVTIAATARVLPSLLSAEILDRTHALHGRLTTAIELGLGERTPLVELAIEDALARTNDVSPARAFPIRVPTNARALVLACAALLVASTLRHPPPQALAPIAAPRLAPLLVHADDLVLEQDALRQLEDQADPTPELRRAIDDTNELLEALEDRSIDRTEALRELAALTARLDRPRPTSLVAREERLQAIGDRLGRGETTAELARALRDSDAAAAQHALEALADRVRDHDLSREEQRRLREALAEARAADDGDPDLLHDAEDALAQQRAEPSADPEEQRLLEQQREEAVEQAREQNAQRMEAERELERLERELDEAAQQMGGSQDGQSEAAQSLDEAAEDLNRTARDQASEEQMQQLAQQLQQLREMIRRQREQQGGDGQDGEGGQGSGHGSQGGQQGRMDRFVLRAGGEGEGSEGTSVGVRQSGGSEGQGQAEGSEGQGGEDENGTPGGTSGSAQGEDGEGGDGQGEGESQQMLVLGDQSGEGGSAILELPGGGMRGQGDARGPSEGEGDESGGQGHEHGGASLDDPTDRQGDHRTVTVHGDDRGRGPSRSEVIRGGAARGFASRDYERVYAEYEQHAERAIEEDQIPPGYRFYVRRYFDLIRPRD